MSEARPERIGRYAVLAELGRGAMGVVYKARDPQLDRLVAIKSVRRDLGLAAEEDGLLRKRVYQEAMAAGRLTHPNIVAIHDVVELDEIPYIVMEYVEGRTLADLIAAQGPLPPPQAVRFVSEVCSGLDYAHARGVVHRDIKPGNILVTAGGMAKVSDFGIARIAGSRVTRTGAFLGTPAYMAPEQLRGRAPDARTDVFAAGVTLYEALAGAPPFDGDDLAAVLYQIIHEVPAPVSERNPAVPRPLEPVIERAMAKDPEARYPTAREFGEALNQAMTARTPIVHALAEAPTQAMTVQIGTGAKAATRRADAASRSPRRRAPAALVAVACLAAAAIVGWTVWARWPSERPTVASRAPSQTEPQTTSAAVTPPAGAKPIAASPSPSQAEPQASPAAVTPSSVPQASAEPSRPREAAPAPAVTPRPATRSSARSSSPSEVPAEPAAVTRPTDPDRSASTAIASAPSGGVSPAAPPPVEKPALPTASSGTIEAPPEPVTAVPPAPVEDSRARQAPALGAIRVSTDPSVDVFLDGEFRGRTESQPLVVSKVSPGRRVLTLRLGAREQIVLATVNGGHTTAVTHQFPAEPARPTTEKLRDALEQGHREAVDKLREGVDKAQREVVGGIRGLLEKIDPDREKRGRDQERKPDRR